MNNNYYSVIGILAIIIHIIININEYRKKDSKVYSIDNNYRIYLLSVFVYYITDASWGIINSWGKEFVGLLYVDTVLYYIAMASSVVFWCRYVISYLNLKGLVSKILNSFGLLFWWAVIILLGINHFYHVFFWFDAAGEYQAFIVRYLALFIQVVMFAAISLLSLVSAVRTTASQRRRNTTICIFGFLMSLTVIAQILYPLLPIYSIGLMIGTIVLHVFVEEDEKEEFRSDLSNALIEAEVATIKLQEALVSAKEAGEAKTQFLFNMSHDIRTPMNAIIGFTELLKKHIDDKEAVLGYIEKIEASNDFLLSLINNVLEMARIESGKESLDEVSCNAEEFGESIHVLFENQCAEKNISFIRNFHVNHTAVLVDKTKMREIMLNIISNAVKYTPAGGTVKVELHELPSDREGYVLFQTTVEDTGIGMSQEFLPHLFEEFSRERTSTASGVIGTGLGMPIVKKIVNLMHGTIEVESSLGKGTKFTVTLPHRIAEYSEGREICTDNASEWDDYDYSGKRILLAEDNDLNAEIAMTIYSEEGFIVERAEDGIICLSMLEKAPADYYDLVLMDVQMPNMDGYKATTNIRRLQNRVKANIPIIAMTANAFEEDRKNAFCAGMNDHLAKPIQIDELKQSVARVLNHGPFRKDAFIQTHELFVKIAAVEEFINRYKELGVSCGCFAYESVKEEKILYADENTLNIFGCDSYADFLEHVGGSFKSLVGAGDIGRVENEIKRQFFDSTDSIDRVEYEIVRKDGKTRLIDDIGKKFYMDNGFSIYCVMIADITDI